MPNFVDALNVPVGVEALFDWFRDPLNMLRLAPPELRLEILAAPQRLELGSCVELKGRRWGMVQRSTLEVTVLEQGKMIVEEQRAGPFRQWKHMRRFEAFGDVCTRLTDEVIFEPPGGMLGLVVNAAFVERELAAFFEYRNQRLHELLSAT